MSNKQHIQKKNLKVSKGILRKEVDKLRDNWINAGPGVPGVDPEVALDRLRFAQDHLAQCVRKYEMAHNGEELFALPFSEYPELAQTEKDIKLFDQLFSLCGSRRPTSVPSLQYDSWPSDEVVGGAFGRDSRKTRRAGSRTSRRRGLWPARTLKISRS